jgi:D-arginine dehydrogenase
MLIEHDIVVIGGGMAGASVAAHLAQHALVRLLEMEPQPGYHSTGRSAALFAEWSVRTTQATLRARIVVNAAGAWAGEIGRLAGALDIGLQPLKRTACLIDQPAGHGADRWPMLLDVEEQFYAKPDAGMLLLSPADETLTRPCDAQADELDVAVAVDRLEQATTLEVKRVTHRWAGLRSFVEDRSPVVGYDPRVPGFFWHAALGGYGIQTAPALGRVAAALLLGRAVDEDVLAHGVVVQALAPERILRPADRQKF